MGLVQMLLPIMSLQGGVLTPKRRVRLVELQDGDRVEVVVGNCVWLYRTLFSTMGAVAMWFVKPFPTLLTMNYPNLPSYENCSRKLCVADNCNDFTSLLCFI